MSDKQAIRIDYTNHRGERRIRKVRPIQVWFGDSPYHKGEQWFFEAWDCARNRRRDFLLVDIHAFHRLDDE